MLNPFLDNQGVIRVGGRLANSDFHYDQKHPIILPNKHPFVKYLITHMHRKYLHAGNNFLLNQIRKEFWPLNARNTIRSVLSKFIVCFRVKPHTLIQKMGDLPSARVTPSTFHLYRN